MTSILHLSRLSAKNMKRRKPKLHTFAKQKVTKQQLTNAETKENCLSLSTKVAISTKWIEPASNPGPVLRATTSNS